MEPVTDPRLEGVRALAREEVAVARDWLLRAVERQPDDAVAHAYLGCALLASGDVHAGMGHTALALELAPDGFTSNLKAGELDLRLGDPSSAEARFLAALRAAAPGSRDREAARALLSEARRRSRASIPHHAFLPSWRWLGRLGGRRKERAETRTAGEAGGTIA